MEKKKKRETLLLREDKWTFAAFGMNLLIAAGESFDIKIEKKRKKEHRRRAEGKRVGTKHTLSQSEWRQIAALWWVLFCFLQREGRDGSALLRQQSLLSAKRWTLERLADILDKEKSSPRPNKPQTFLNVQDDGNSLFFPLLAEFGVG